MECLFGETKSVSRDFLGIDFGRKSKCIRVRNDVHEHRPLMTKRRTQGVPQFIAALNPESAMTLSVLAQSESLARRR